MCNRICSNTPDLYTADASSKQYPSTDIENVSQHCQISPGEPNIPQLRATILTHHHRKHFLLQYANIGYAIILKFLKHKLTSNINSIFSRIPLPPCHSCNIGDTGSSLCSLFQSCFCITRRGLMKACLAVCALRQPMYRIWYVQL